MEPITLIRKKEGHRPDWEIPFRYIWEFTTVEKLAGVIQEERTAKIELRCESFNTALVRLLKMLYRFRNRMVKAEIRVLTPTRLYAGETFSIKEAGPKHSVQKFVV